MGAIVKIGIEFNGDEIDATFSCSTKTVNELLNLINNNLEEKIKNE